MALMIQKLSVKNNSLSYEQAERNGDIADRAVSNGTSVTITDRKTGNVYGKVDFLNNMQSYVNCVYNLAAVKESCNLSTANSFKFINNENKDYIFDALSSVHTPDANKYWNRIARISNVACAAQNDPDFFTGKDVDLDILKNYEFCPQDYLLARSLSDSQFSGSITQRMDDCAMKILAEEFQNKGTELNPKEAASRLMENIGKIIESTPDLAVPEQADMIKKYLSYLPNYVQTIPAVADYRQNVNTKVIEKNKSFSDQLNSSFDIHIRNIYADLARGKFPGLDEKSFKEENGVLKQIPFDACLYRNGSLVDFPASEYITIVNSVADHNGGIIPSGTAETGRKVFVSRTEVTKYQTKQKIDERPVSDIKFPHIANTKTNNPVLTNASYVDSASVANMFTKNSIVQNYRNASRHTGIAAKLEINAQNCQSMEEYIAKYMLAAKTGMTLVTDKQTMQMVKTFAVNKLRSFCNENGIKRESARMEFKNFDDKTKDIMEKEAKRMMNKIAEITRIQSQNQNKDRNNTGMEMY